MRGNIWTEPTVNKTQNTEGEENILPQTSVCSADEDLKASMQVYVLWFSYLGGGFSLILWLRNSLNLVCTKVNTDTGTLAYTNTHLRVPMYMVWFSPQEDSFFTSHLSLNHYGCVRVCFSSAVHVSQIHLTFSLLKLSVSTHTQEDSVCLVSGQMLHVITRTVKMCLC